MDLKKAFDQTVREIKREVNKKVLKVPEIEQKVLDATSNEPWGPHGALMADIAQSTRNYNEYQMIMAILWKRLTDNGKNWRHVYKALTVLEFLVANGAERVIDDIREHSYQVQTLVDFQYVEASGKDQGSNVRKKAQTIVGIINDKERIREVRQKAAANREKYKGMSSTGGIYKSSSYSSTGGSYGGDRYDRDDERYGGGSRYGGRDDEKYRDGDRYRDEDRYRRDGDRHGRDGDRYRDDDLGNDRDHDDDHYGSKVADHYGDKYEGNARDRDRDQGYEDDSTKARGKLDDYSHDERDGGIASAVARATKAASQLEGTSSSGLVMSKTVAGASLITSDSIEDFDDFDPRACRTNLALPPVTVEQDLFGETQVQPQPTTLPKYGSNVEYLLGESAFQSSFVAAPVSSSASFANLDQNGSFFQSSTLTTLSGSSNFTAFEGNAFPPHPPLTTTSSNDFSPFSTASTNNFHTHNNCGTFPLELPNNINSSSSDDFSSFSAAPNNSQSRADFFGDSTFSAFGATENKIDAMPAVTPMAHDTQTNSVKGSAKPPSTKDQLEPKSSVWADHLSSGLLDFNIAKPKNNPLAELGIHLDSSLTGTERKREVASAPLTKGKAMGSGSGLGIVGASILNPPLAPLIMGGGMGLGPGVSVGQGIGMGYGMNPGLGMAPRMGMNPGMAPSIGLNTSPAMMQGSGPGQTLGMGMDPSFGLGMGMGGYPNQQQQFGGYR